MTPRVVVLGGGYAGLMAALRLANRGRRRFQILLINASDEFVERIRNHELAASKPPRRRSIPRMLRRTGVIFVHGRAVQLDTTRKIVTLADGCELPFARLILALGSVADVSVPGAREHAFPVATEAGAQRIRDKLASGARRISAVGGGLTGIEIAAELADGHPERSVALVAPGRPGVFLSDAARDYLVRAFDHLGVTLVDGVVRNVRSGWLDLGDRSLETDLCVWAGGFVAPPLARAAGLSVNDTGQVLVDAQLRSLSHPDIYAVGDAAATTEQAGAPILMGCKYSMPMAAHAADNVAHAFAGRVEQPFRFGDSVFCLSLGRKNGLIQRMTRDGKPTGIITGRLGAFIKEFICRLTVWSLRLERHFVFYRWPPAPRALPAAAEQKRLAG
jgi:NADH dehydrogenase FAD-containing subunit